MWLIVSTTLQFHLGCLSELLKTDCRVAVRTPLQVKASSSLTYSCQIGWIKLIACAALKVRVLDFEARHPITLGTKVIVTSLLRIQFRHTVPVLSLIR